MSLESIDYTALITDLESKMSALGAMLAAVRAAQASGALGQPGEGPVSTFVPSASGGEVPVGAFLGKSIPEAAKLCLQIVKRKLTSREVADALRKGGIESTAKNFPPLVHSILMRASRVSGSAIVKLDRSHWGLAEWYPAGVGRSTAAPKKRGKRRKGPGRPKKVETVPVTTAKKDEDSSWSRIVGVLKSKRGIELSKEDIAGSARVSVGVVGLLLGKLVKMNKAEKTASGKYRSMAA